jgi:protein-L-isoaspartate(D-aspartate) O-methyltransferase
VIDESRKIRLLMELRREGITSTKVLSAMEKVPRENFVMASMADRAYENNALPIASGQTISQPYVVAIMTAALDCERRRVLEIGTGSGYQAAVLAQLARRVYTMERHRPLNNIAKKVINDLGISNVSMRYGDGFKGWPEAAPFDRILVTAAAPDVPDKLLEQLSDNGGIMVIPVGPSGAQQVLKITKNGDDITTEELIPVRFVPMLKGTEAT